MTKSMPDLTGRTVIITGANSGLGYEATKVFAEKGATVVMACRSVDRADEAARCISREVPGASIEVLKLDLADLGSVREFVDTFTAEYDDLHILCNNAGVMAIPRRETADGFETQFSVNHLGHFALTGLLLDSLAETDGETRVVTQSSRAHESGEIDFEDLQHERSYDKWAVYRQSKLANVLFAYELDRRLSATGLDVKSVACHPGYAATELQGRGPEMEGSTARKLLMAGANQLVAQSAAMGALPMLYAATASTIEGGEYIGPDGIAGARGYPTKTKSSSRSYDRTVAERLWDVSEELTGVEFGLDRASDENTENAGNRSEPAYERLDGSDGRVLGYELSGQVTEAAMEAMAQDVERVAAAEGDVRLLIRMSELSVPEAGAISEDFATWLEHGEEIERIAIIDNSRLVEKAIEAEDRVIDIEMESFDGDELDRAWAWVRD